MRFLALAALLILPAHASIFIMAICKDGVIVVEDSRMAFSDTAKPSSPPIAYADGLNKIVRFDSAVLATTGQGFIGDDRFDEIVRRFERASGSLAPEAILPALLGFAGPALAAQHIAVAKFANGKPVLCGYDGKLGPCLDSGYIESSRTDFDRFRLKLPAMPAADVAAEARASMQRYIAANNKSATMGGEFSAVLLTSSGARELWTLKNSIQARTLDDLVEAVRARRIKVTLVPPATPSDLDEILQ